MTDPSNQTELIRLLYFSAFSQDFPIDEPAQDAEIANIIRTSVRNNRQNAITGMLLVHQRCFIQALEGPSLAVMATYQRITSDRRHNDTSMIAVGRASNRSFSNWNMCARRLSDVDDAILETLDLKGQFKPESLTPDKTLHLLSLVAATISVRRLGQQNAIPTLLQSMALPVIAGARSIPPK